MLRPVTEQILLQSTNPVRPDPADVAGLASQLSNELGYQAKTVDPRTAPEGTRAVTWWEVLHIWLPAGAISLGVTAVEALIGKLIDVFVEWARTRMREYEEEHTGLQAPPQHVTIYGPDGKPLRKVTLHNPIGEPEIEDPGEYDSENPPPSS
jgi:hypothetical protein